MKKFNFMICLLSLISLLLITGCGESTTVSRVSVDEVHDLSGRWNDTDSELVAQQMVKDVTSRIWLTDYLTENSKKPAVIVGGVRNKSSEHIDTETFVTDIERELINSGKIKFVASSEQRKKIRAERDDQQDFASEETAKRLAQELGADFMMIGSVKSILDQAEGKKVKFYQTDLELINVETNEKVWIGTKKIKKLVQQSKSKF